MAKSVPAQIAARLREFRQAVKSRGATAALVTDMNNVRWLSGFTGSDASLLVLPRGQVLFTDSRYAVQAGAEASGWTVVQAQNKITDVMDRARRGGVKKLGFEPEGMTHGRFLMYRKAARGLVLVRLPEVIKKLRAVKTADESRRIERAAAVALDAFNGVVSKARPGMSERDFALLLDNRMRELGSERLPFPTIVASGARGALPHGVASAKKLKKGDLVTVDFGAVFEGYQSDQTITFCLGKPTARQRKIYETVREGQARAIALVRPGAVCKDVDAAARDYIRESGFGECFGHGLGHGVGLDTHEEPVLNARSRTALETGMVVTVEPGIYIPGFGGVRIEDMVLVTGKGGRLLTASSGDLREI